MHILLRDWDRDWVLALSHEAKSCPGTAIGDVRIAQRTLARLIRDRGNFSAIRTLLSSDTSPARPLSNRERPILTESARRLEGRRWVLLQGAPYVRRPSSRPQGGEAEKEVWDFVPMESDLEGRPEAVEDLPVLRFVCEEETVLPLRFAHGAEQEPGIRFGHGAESGPEVRFAHAADGSDTVGHSASVMKR